MKSALLSAILAAATFMATAAEINVGNMRSATDSGADAASHQSFKEKYQFEKSDALRKLRSAKLPARLWDDDFPGNDQLITNPQGTKSRYAMAGDIFLSNMGGVHIGGFGAEVIISDDGTKFYTKALTLNFYQQGYSEGTIDGDKVTFPSGQYIYDTYEGEKAYMFAAYFEEEDDEWPILTDTFTLTKDEQGRYVSDPDYYFMVLTEEEAGAGIGEYSDIICFGTNYVLTPLPADLKEATVPADAEMFDCQFVANSLLADGASIMRDITVGVSGDKIYVLGLSDYLPTACLVGDITPDGKVVFDSHQYIGYFDEGDYPYLYEFAMVNPIYYYDSLYYNEVESVYMTFNADKTVLIMEEEAGMFICSYADMSSWDEVYWNITMGDFNQPLTPRPVAGLQCYDTYGAPYAFFEWSSTSVEGIPMNTSKLWCEFIINGETYKFAPRYYNGLTMSTVKVYYDTTGVEGMYMGDYSTIYFYEYEYNGTIKSLGVRTGYESDGEIRYSELVYAPGFEPMEDNAFVPSEPTNVIYYRDYYHTFQFDFDGTDVEGKEIPSRLMAVEILLDGEPLVFKDSDYYFKDGSGPDVTMIGLAEHAINYSSSLVNQYGNTYSIQLWNHDELPDFTTVAIRPVCTGADTFTYGEAGEINLLRAAIPANPWNVEYNYDYEEFVFGALPIDTFGNGLAPWNYGYEVYVDDDLFVFKKDAYDLDSDITLIPYEGFEYNYYFYLYSQTIYDESTWQAIGQNVVMEVSMGNADISFQKIGVRAVYTDGEGNTTYSDIVNSDGTTTGVASLGSDSETVRWFNLQGIEVADPAPGAVYLRTQGGKTIKVLVK